MKKFGVVLLGFLMLCIMPVLFACNTVEQIYRVKVVEFTEERVALTVDSQPYQLEWNIEDNVALNQKVTFESSNTRVATVSDQGVVTPVAPGVAVISVTSDDNPKAMTNTCTIQVFPRKQTLATPANLRYLDDTRQISWNKVVENTDGGLLIDTSAFVPKYEVTLVTAEGTTKEVVDTNSYDNLQPGKAYAITVKALGNQYLYDDSAITQILNVHILSAPTNLKISASDEYAELNTGDSMNASSQTYQNRTYTLSFDLPSDGGEDIDDYEIRFLNVNREPISGAAKTAIDNLLADAVIQNKTFVMPLDSTVVSGDYYVDVRALGNNQNDEYNSSYVRTSKIIMLSAPANLALSGANKQMVTWNSVAYANAYKVLIEYKYTNVDTDPYYYATYYVAKDQNCSFSLQGLKDSNNQEFLDNEYYIFNIYLYALGDDTPTVLDSAKSTETARAQLSQVSNVRLKTARDASMDLNLTWDSVANAGVYKVDICQNNQVVHSDEVSANQIVINANADYLEAGEYQIVVTAMSTVNQNYTQSVPSVPFDIIKLATPTLSTTNGLISWNKVDYVDATNGYKLSYMKGADQIVATFNNAQSSYDFSADVMDSGNYTDCTITACGSTTQAIDNIYINSAPSSSCTITKMQLPNKFVVNNGTLSLSDTRFSLYELKVVDDTTNELVNNVYLSSENASSQISTIVSGLSKNTNYVFSLVALKPSSQNDNVLYVKSNTTETIVYVSEKVTDIKAINGVINWKMPNNLFALIKNVVSGQNVLNPRILNNVRYLVTNDQNSSSVYVDAVSDNVLSQTASLTLANMPANQTVKVGIQIVFSNADNPSVCVLNGGVEYADFYQLGTVSVTDVVDDNGNWVLRWQKSNISNLTYDLTISHTDTNNEEHVANVSFEDVLLDDDTTGTYHVVTLSTALLGYELDEGVYSISMIARPSNENSTYLKSYESANPFEFTKLTPPVVTIENGALSWSAPSVLSDLTYNLDINGNVVRDINTTYYEIDNITGEINIKIQAISSTPNILSSAWSESFAIVKLDSANISINTAQITKNSITWSYEYSLTIGGNNIDVPVTEFGYTIAQLDNPINILSSGTITAIDDGLGGKQFTYVMPTNSLFGSGVYILSLTPLASGIENDEATTGIKGYLSGSAYGVYIYKMPQVNDVAITNDKVNWTAATISSINGNNLSETLDVIYSINISTLDQYTYVVNKGTTDEITQGTTDPSSGVYNYFAKQTNNKYSIPLQKQEYTAVTDDGGIIQNIDVLTQNNFVRQGDMFNLTLCSTLNTRTLTESTANPMTYYVFDSNPATIKNIALLDAPTLQFDKGIMSWSNIRTNFDKIVFTFKPYTLDTSVTTHKELVAVSDPTQLEELTKTVVIPSYNTRKYDLSNLFDAANDGIYYILTAQTIGNGSRTISSRVTTYSYAITNILDIAINTQSTTTNSNGWYIEDGAICWKAIEGVASYVLRFEGVKIENANETIVRTLEKTIPTSTGQTYYRYIPDSELNLPEDFYLTFKAIGGAYTDALASDYSDYLCKVGALSYAGVYANSKYIEDSTAKQIMRQLSTNDTMYVYNGELTWLNNQKEVVTGYQIKVNNLENESVAVLEKAQDASHDELTITFSDSNKDTDQYHSSIRAIGTNWVGRDASVPANGIYLTSRYGRQFAFRYINSDDILPQVVNGSFQWSVSNVDISTWGALYTVGLTQNNGDDIVWLTRQTTTTNDLAAYSAPAKCQIYALGVKVLGNDDSTRTSGIPLVNSTLSRQLYNLYKLPDIANFESSGQQIVINQIGDIVWNCGYDNALANLGLETIISTSRLNGKTQSIISSSAVSIGAKPLNAAVTYNYDVNTSMPSDNISPIFKFDINVRGSAEYQYEIDSGAVTYLSSNAATIQAPKYTAVSSFTINNGVNFVWNIDTSYARIYDQPTDTSTIMRPDMLMIEYVDTDHYNINTNTLDNGSSFTMLTISSTLNDLYINNLAQFLPNGEYVLKLSAYSSSGDIFRSAPVYCQFSNSRAINLGVFDELTIIDNLPYFEIANAQQLADTQYVLTSNVLTSTGSMTLTGSSETIYEYNVQKGANFIMTDDITLNSVQGIRGDNIHANVSTGTSFELYGIFDGDGHTISNIQMLNSAHPGLFDTIKMNAAVKDLTLIYSSVDVNMLGYTYDYTQEYIAPTDTQYFGLLANYNYGLVSNCHVTASQEDIIGEDYFDATDYIIMGMLVGFNGHTVLEDESIVRAKVIDCTNGINLYRSTPIALGQTIQLGGIVGENNGADIINCCNGLANDANLKGNLMGYCVGGIAYANANKGFIGGCVNYGTLNIYASKENNAATAGGIVAFNEDSDIVYCVNRGNINARHIVMTVSYNSATIGGIVGRIYEGGNGTSLIANCLQTYDAGQGLHVHFVGGEGDSGSAWEYISIGYILGQEVSSDTITVRDCAYKKYIVLDEFDQPDASAQEYYANRICGNGDDIDYNNIVAIDDDITTAVNLLNSVSGLVAADLNKIILNNLRPVFAKLDDNIVMLFIDNTAYSQISDVTSQTKALSADNTFVIDGFDTAIINYSVMYSSDNTTFVTNVPTSAGAYTVKVTYYVTISAIDYVIGTYTYGYTLE